MSGHSREERSARTAAQGPTPRNTGPRKTSTDVHAVKKANAKRARRRLRRLEEAQRRREGLSRFG